MRTIIFPDTEKLITATLPSLLLSAGVALADFRVATRKLQPNRLAPKHQIIVRSDGGTIYDRALKEESMTILIWTKTANSYGDANSMALRLEALLPLLATKIWNINNVEGITVSPIDSETEEELREITFNVIVKGQDLSL